MAPQSTAAPRSRDHPLSEDRFRDPIALPPAPGGFEEEALAGTFVVAHRTDHSIVEGWLRRVDAGGVDLVAREGTDAHFGPEELLYLLFVRPIRYSEADGMPACEAFTLEFADGSQLSGCAVERIEDALGLHLFRCFQNTVRRLFVPASALATGARWGPAAAAGGDDACAGRHAPVLASNVEIRRWLERPRQRGSEVPTVDLSEVVIEDEAVKSLPADVARRYGAVPLVLTESAVAVAMSNPQNLEALRLIGFVTGRRVEPLQGTEKAIHDALFRCYDAAEGAEMLKALKLSRRSPRSEEGDERMEQLAREQPVVRFVNSLVTEAVHRRASDIHIRPGEDDFRILYRIDGSLVPVRRLDGALLAPIVSRVKIIGGMDITERRRPQDGRAVFSEHDLVVDMRISVMPTVVGESVVIRLLNAREGIRALSELGLAAHDEQRLRQALSRSFGMVLVTGPTGSGKSTTLYAALLELRKRDVNIITIEDPVEYFIDDVEQIQVNAGIGFTFARALRNILRHDPDIVMVGEIRDQETAEIAVESALTGHLILSTLHTNDAVTTVTRLLDLGVQPFLLKSTLLAVLAQRLVKRNCPHCLVEEEVPPDKRALVGAGPDERFFRGAGCDACDGLGHHGRTAVYELLAVTPELRALIAEDVDAERLREQGLADGMVPLTQNALAAARGKITSLAEVFRVRLE